jgi:RNA polymerase sigma-70 factor (ECF subfamily)
MPGDSKTELDIDRFRTTALAHIDSIYRFALYMIQDEEEAQKLVLYTYLKACKSLDRYSDKERCRMWLLAILNDAIMKISPVLPEAAGGDS